MLRTALCDLLGIDVPIMLAAMGTAASAEFAAAVSNEGGLGSIASFSRTTAAIIRDIDRVAHLTNRHYAVNHIPPLFDAEAFRHTLAARPAVISFALGHPGIDLVRQAHDIGALVMVQVTTVAEAVEAAREGADAVIAQGGEAGGYSGGVSTMTLVPQVVDAVSPIPVVAAGGIFDGRGIAAAMMLGAVGVSLGTRFLASEEAPIDDTWKRSIANAQSEDAVKFESLNVIHPLPEPSYPTALRSLRTPFIDEWNAKPALAGRERERLWGDIVSRMQQGRRSELILTAGQTAGGIKEILPVAEIMRRLVAEAEAALLHAPRPI